MKKVFLLLLFVCVLFLQAFPLKALNNSERESLFNTALSQSRESHFVEALDSWNEFLLSFPEDAIALSNRGNIRLALGDPQGAMRDQTDAMEILPLEIDPHLNRGIAEEFLKEWDLAIADYQWVLERDPSNFYAFYNLANVMGSQNDWVQSKSYFNKALIANSDFVMARLGRALADYQLNELEEAEKELRQLIRQYPLFADARAALSALLWKLGSVGEAQSHWAAAVGLDDRYMDKNWLLTVRRWPPTPINDLMKFLDSAKV